MLVSISVCIVIVTALMQKVFKVKILFRTLKFLTDNIILQKQILSYLKTLIARDISNGENCHNMGKAYETDNYSAIYLGIIQIRAGQS